jgi:hypothetical protein
MAASIDQLASSQRVGKHPLWLSILGGFSLLLGVVTFPQFY